MKKVIFISGMHGSKRDMFLFKKILKNYDLIYFRYNANFSEKIEEYSKQLKQFIKKLNLDKKEKVSIISLSAGGIIASYYLKFFKTNKVDKLITLCSPFKGTWIWLLFPNRKGIYELRPNSILLKKLASKKLKSIRELNFWCFLDLLVPGTSGKGKNSKHTLFFLHWIIQFWPPIIFKVKEFLDR